MRSHRFPVRYHQRADGGLGFAGNTGGNMVGPSNQGQPQPIGPRFGFPVWFHVLPPLALPCYRPHGAGGGKRPPLPAKSPGGVDILQHHFLGGSALPPDGGTSHLRAHFTRSGAGPYHTIPGHSQAGTSADIDAATALLCTPPGPCPAMGPGADK